MNAVDGIDSTAKCAKVAKRILPMLLHSLAGLAISAVHIVRRCWLSPAVDVAFFLICYF